MASTAPVKQAVVLSGGGAKGAYEVGVLQALLRGETVSTRYRPIDPQVWTGTSVGAYNAAFMVSQPGRPALATAAELELIWRRRIADTQLQCGNGVFRVRGFPFQFLDPGCFNHPVEALTEWARDSVALAGVAAGSLRRFLGTPYPLPDGLLEAVDLSGFISNAPLRKLIDETLDPRGVVASGKALRVTTANWRMGNLRLFGEDAFAHGLGKTAVLASTAIPGLFPPVPIEGDPFVDGGLLQNTPLNPAIRLGANVIHVLYVDPLITDDPPLAERNTLDTVARSLEISWAASVKADLAQAKRINDGIALLDRSGGRANPASVNELFAALGETGKRLQAGQQPRPLEIHIHRPRRNLGGGLGLIDFHSHFIDELIRLGRLEARTHNCQQAGCLLP